MCGASEVLGLDIDYEAIRSARRSWSLNESNGGFNLRDIKIEFLQDHITGFDVIVVNILYEPLLSLADTLAAVAVPGARLCLTGVRGEQTESAEQLKTRQADQTEPTDQTDQSAIQKLQRAYEKRGFQNFTSSELSAGWYLLTAEKMPHQESLL
eukprot:Skav226506  [mRNA]  locus=scaffold1773:18585:19327:+ [translate_table: standard]